MPSKLLTSLAIAAATLMAAPVATRAQSTTALTESWRHVDYLFQPVSVATDAAQNVFSLGHSFVNGSIVLRKFAPASGTPQWQNNFNRPGVYSVINASRVVVGNDGAPVVVALIYGSLALEPTGWLILKYDSAGTLLWERTIAGSGALDPLQATLDDGNNLYVAGMLSTLEATSYVSGSTLAKFSPAGDLLWKKTTSLQNPPGFIRQVVPTALVLSPDGTRLALAASLDSSRFVARGYDTEGNLLWSSTYLDEPALDRTLSARDVAFGPNNVTYFAASTRPVSGPDQMTLVKYDANGLQNWVRTFDIGREALRIRTDAAGNVIATGTAANGTLLDWMTFKTNANGDLLWSRRHDAHKYSNEVPSGLTLDAAGAVYVTGTSGPSFAGITATTGTVVKYDSNGFRQWSTWDTAAHGGGLSVAPTGSALATLGFATLVTTRLTPTGLLEPVPAAPVNLNATLGGGQINLTFTDNAVNEYWHEIERCTGTTCATFQKLGETGGQNSTQYTDATTAEGYTYRYRVRALGFMGASAYSPTATVSVPLPAPANLSGSVITSTRIDLTWANTSTSHTGIRIERCKGATCTGFSQIASVSPATTSFSNTGLSRRTTYRYRIRSYTATANSPYSAIISVTTPR